MRGSISASDNGWATMLYSDGQAYFSPTYRIHIVDRVGGGDSFGGGLIYSLIMNKEPQDARQCFRTCAEIEGCRIKALQTAGFRAEKM